MSQELQTPQPPVRRPRPARPAPPVHHHHKSAAELIHEAEDASFVVRHRVKFIVAGVLAVAVGIYFLPKPKASAPARKAEQIVQVQLPPPPPPKLPPPPPPKVQPPPEKMEKETQPTEAPKEAVKAPPKADNPPPSALATGIKGDGPGMGLASSGGGLGGGPAIGGTGTGGNSASKWGWYAGQVQAKIADALRQHPKTRAAAISSLQVRIWPDASGRVSRVQLVGSTGSRDLDAALESEVLRGLQLQEPPPAGMKLPINLRISAKRQG